MSTLYITEFFGLQSAAGVAHQRESAQIAVLPGATQTVAISAASAASAPMASTTRLVRLHALAGCHVAIDRAATPADLLMPTGQTEYFGVAPGAVLHVLEA